MIKSNFFNDTENHTTKSEELNIKVEPLLYTRELPAKDRDNEEENDSENVEELGQTFSSHQKIKRTRTKRQYNNQQPGQNVHKRH